jgi:hypothetical protein
MEVGNTPGWVNLVEFLPVGGAQWRADMAKTLADQFAEVLAVNGARNFPNYGEVKFPSLAGGVIRRRFDRGLRFLAAVRDV